MKFSKLFNKLLPCNTKVKVYLETDYVGNSSVSNYIGTYVVGEEGEEETPEREICESSVVCICPAGCDELDVIVNDKKRITD